MGVIEWCDTVEGGGVCVGGRERERERGSSMRDDVSEMGEGGRGWGGGGVYREVPFTSSEYTCQSNMGEGVCMYI